MEKMEFINITKFFEFNKSNLNGFDEIFKNVLRNIRIDKLDSFFYDLKNDNLYLEKTFLEKFEFTKDINFDKYIEKNKNFEFNIKKENHEYDMFKEKVFSKVKENFKNFKNLNDLLKTRKILNESYENYKNDKVSSIDIEYTKIKQKFLITEIGYTIKNLKQKKLITKHFYIKENLEHIKSKKFLYGFSEVKNLKEALKEVEKDFKDVKLITGNNITEDLKFLKMFGLSINNSKVLDLGVFFKFFYKDHEKQNLKLSSLSRVLLDDTIIPHNAGNDAYYGIKTFCKLINSYNNNTYEEIIKKFNKFGDEEPLTEMSIVNNLKNRKTVKLKNLYEDKNTKVKIVSNEAILKQELVSISRTIPFLYNSLSLTNKPKKSDFKDKIQEIYINLRNENKVNIFLSNTDHHVVTDVNSYCVFLKELKKHYKDIEYNFDLFIPNNFCIIKEDLKKEQFKDLSLL